MPVGMCVLSLFQSLKFSKSVSTLYIITYVHTLHAYMCVALSSPIKPPQDVTTYITILYSTKFWLDQIFGKLLAMRI